jgi:segregation and condensation protein B
MPEMQEAELKEILETLLFITDRPLPLSEIAKVSGAAPEEAERILRALQREFEEGRRPVQILEVAEGFQMATRAPFAGYVRKLFADKLSFRLSQASLETLSIIAYRQPITRAEIEEIRGVEVIAALETLLEKRLIKVVGRKEVVGRPLLYGTTLEFLRHFGLKSLEELPSLESFTPPPAETPSAAGGVQTSGPTAGGGVTPATPEAEATSAAEPVGVPAGEPAPAAPTAGMTEEAPAGNSPPAAETPEEPPPPVSASGAGNPE